MASKKTKKTTAKTSSKKTARKPEPVRPLDPTREQCEEIAHGIDSEGFDYYFCEYTSLGSFEKQYGPLPQDMHDAWARFDEAYRELESTLARRGATLDTLEETEEDEEEG